MRGFLCVTLLTLAILCIPSVAQGDADYNKSLTGPAITFDPAHQKPVSYSDKSIRVDLIIGKERDSLSILSRASGAEKRVDLPEEIAQVDEIRKVVGNKLVVRGMVNGSGSEIAVIDILSARQIDKFLCYGPRVSPDGRYIAFVKFYPSHFAEGTEDHYMLYDLDKSPRNNRPPVAAGDDWQTVGICIYPTGIGNKAFDNVRRPEGSQHSSRSEFYWNPGKEEVFFADQVDSDDQITLVIADVGTNEHLSLRTAEQRTDQLCASIKAAASASCSLLVRRAEFKNGIRPMITALFEILERRQLKTVEYSASNFHAGS